MRVRISYSVGLDEVPEEVTRLLENANSNVGNVRDLLENMIDMLGNNLMSADWAKSEISKLRDLLARIDYCLADSDSILQGYFDATITPKQEVSDVE